MLAWAPARADSTTSETIKHRSLDMGGSERGRLMFPDPNHQPIVRGKALVRVHVADPVALDLVDPEGGVRLRLPAMLWAAMPPTAIDEYRHPGPREHDVSLASEPRQKLAMHEVPQASAVELSTKGHLRASVMGGLTAYTTTRLASHWDSGARPT